MRFLLFKKSEEAFTLVEAIMYAAMFSMILATMIPYLYAIKEANIETINGIISSQDGSA